MKNTHVSDRKVEDRAFKLLHETLQNQRLPCAIGWRLARWNEFMFMGVVGLEYAFKHMDTRNYLYIPIDPLGWFRARWLDCHGEKSDFHQGDFTRGPGYCSNCGDTIPRPVGDETLCDDCAAPEPSKFAGMGYLEGTGD